MFTNSIFGDLLKPLSRGLVKSSVVRHGTDRWRKSFTSWDHLVVMLGAQFSGAASLRDVETVFNPHATHHYHLGCGGVKRSTLADANRDRDCRFFRDVALGMIAGAGKQRREMHGLVSVLDSSLIRLHGRGLGWAAASRTRAHNQGLKLHLQIDRVGADIEYIEVTDSRVNDITAAQGFPLQANRIYVFDKGYCDYNWWKSIADKGSRFVTRLKRNAAFDVVEERPITAADAGFVLSDQVIVLSNKAPRGGKTNELAGTPLRLVRIQHPGGSNKPFLIVSNAIDASAEEIAGWYKERWSIELFFKWIKQNLKIKRFMGESRNAILIQLYTAIIAYTLLKLYHDLTSAGQTQRLKDVLILARANLFSRPKTTLWQRRKRRAEQQKQYQFCLNGAHP